MKIYNYKKIVYALEEKPLDGINASCMVHLLVGCICDFDKCCSRIDRIFPLRANFVT